MYKLMQGKKGIITGITNEHSIAYSIAKQLHEQGASLAFTYPNDKIKKRLLPIANSLDSNMLFECDVSRSDSIEHIFNPVKEEWNNIDFIVHSIAFSDKNELQGRLVDTSLNNFLNTMHISCYSFIELCRVLSPLINPNGSILTLSYYGAQKVLPNYNVMGLAKAALETSVKYLAADFGGDQIRVNAISSGPIKTLAASGIGEFSKILQWNSSNSPLKRTVSQHEVGKSALYLLSDLSSGVTGEIHYVDAGYNIIGMKAKD